MKNFYITENERNLIASTPQKECWICDLFSNNIRKNNNGFFISENTFSDDGIVEHLHQIIRRKFILSA